MRKIIKTRAKVDEANLPSHDRVLVITFRMVVRRRGLTGSVAGRALESSDTEEARLEFIDIPPWSWFSRSTQQTPEKLIEHYPKRFALELLSSSFHPIGRHR
jgi:hypothetical protein